MNRNHANILSEPNEVVINVRHSPLHYMQVTLANTDSLIRERFKICLDAWAAKNFAELETSAKQLRARDPDSPLATAFCGVALYYTGRFDEALEYLEQSLAINQNFAVAHYFAGLIIGKKGTLIANSTACAHFRAAARLYPDWIDNLVALGQFCYFTGAAREAISYLRKVIEVEPENLDAHTYLVNALAWLGEHDELGIHLNKADQAIFQQDVKDMESQGSAKKPQIKFARYPDQQDLKDSFIETIKKTVLSDLDPIAPFIKPDTRFFTLGSCFASNLSRALSAINFACYNLEIGETINTTYANRYIFEWINGEFDPDVEQRMSELLPGFYRETLIDQIRNADVIIYTLGVAACFFDRQTNHFILPRGTQLNSRALASKYEARMTSVEENVANMKIILEEMRKINPHAIIFLSVSPVPLQATFERKASVNADCVSKSILRVAAEDTISAGYPNVHYWPSFEIVRWLGGHVGPFYGTDDGCSLHMSEQLIHQIAQLFVELFRVRTVQA